ncbi:phage tail terminator family protein [Paenibacillus solani]|uniref:phage tail terminator family protein n=1 Tax=Paenibacillus solani TaxID=1705565 RepID=UPI003D266BB7
MNADQVTDAVTFKLDQTFGWPVYGKNRQGLKEPCFIVLLLNVDHGRLQGRRYARGHQFNVHFFSATNDDFIVVADRLFDVLEWIEIDGLKFKGTGMNFEVIDDVMHFYVDYNYHVMRAKEPGIKMKQMEQEGRLK